jgi:acetyl esterase/lipase
VVEKKAPSFEEMVRMRVVLTVPGMDAVRSGGALVYKRVGDELLHMDVYAPPGSPRQRPVVVLIHGGPVPRLGARKMGVFVSYGELLAASGFVAVAFDHRFLAPERLADAACDLADLVAHVRANGASLGVDPDRVALWAFSGGGPLLAHPLRERPTWLRALVAYYAVLDLQQPPPGADIGMSEELRRTFSPVCSLEPQTPAPPPVLVARAGLDSPWLSGGLDRFVQAALARGVSLDLLNHPEGRHAFDILDDEERSRQIIRRTLDFLREHLAA